MRDRGVGVAQHAHAAARAQELEQRGRDRGLVRGERIERARDPCGLGVAGAAGRVPRIERQQVLDDRRQ